MKTILALFLFVVATLGHGLAQDQHAIAAAQAACGPNNVRFDVNLDGLQHPAPPPDPDKALVYIVQEMGQEKCKGCALTKLGLDGNWVGANNGDSYFYFSTEPGEHHLCLNWQSHFGWRSKAFAMANFTAEAGRVYYFRARIFPGHLDYSFDLDPINGDQGKFLVASSIYSVSQARK